MCICYKARSNIFKTEIVKFLLLGNSNQHFCFIFKNKISDSINKFFMRNIKKPYKSGCSLYGNYFNMGFNRYTNIFTAR